MHEQHIDYSLLRPGAIIGYHLKASDRPLHPNKVWKGRVIRWVGGTFRLVEILEPGYHNLTEPVKIDQIVAVSEEYKAFATANQGMPVIVSFPPDRYDGGHILVVTGGDSDLVYLSLLLVKSEAMRYNTFTRPGKQSINIKVSLNYRGRLLEYKEGIEPCRGVSSSYPRLPHPVLSQVILN